MLGKRPFGEDGLGNQPLWQGCPDPTLVRVLVLCSGDCRVWGEDVSLTLGQHQVSFRCINFFIPIVSLIIRNQLIDFLNGYLK